jgi:hypothetical protein
LQNFITAPEPRRFGSSYHPLPARRQDRSNEHFYDQVRAARALVRREQKDLVAASKLSLPAIKRTERVRGSLAAQARTIDAIRAAFTTASVIFVEAAPKLDVGAGSPQGRKLR